MDDQNAANPPTVNIQDFHLNTGSNVDTERVMAKISEESERTRSEVPERMISAMMEMLNTQGRAIISTMQGDRQGMTSSDEIPLSETSSTQAERKATKVNLKKMQEVFEFDDKTFSLLQSNKFDEVLPIMKKKINLGQELVYAHQLASYIITSMQGNSSEDNSVLRNELFVLIKDKLNPSGRAVKSLADKFRSNGKSFASALLYLLALEFHANEADGVNSAWGMIRCCDGMKLVAVELIEKKSDSKVVVKQQILPLLPEFQRKIQGIENVPEEVKIDCKARCMLDVATIHLLLGEYESMEESCKVGVEMMESKLPSSYMKHRVYGALLWYLSLSYFYRQRRTDARRCLLQAVAVFNTAEDLESEDQRKKWIEYVNGLLANIP